MGIYLLKPIWAFILKVKTQDIIPSLEWNGGRWNLSAKTDLSFYLKVKKQDVIPSLHWNGKRRFGG